MTTLTDLIIDIQTDIAFEILSFPSIARKHNVPISVVLQAWDLLCEQECEQEHSAYTRALDYYDAMHDDVD